MDPKQDALDNELIRAAHFGDIEAVKRAIKMGANLHARSERAVHVAILAKHKEIVNLLMHMGARTTSAQVAIGYAQESKVDGKRVLVLADSGKFGTVSKKLRLKDRQDRPFEARQFSDGSVLGLMLDRLGNLQPCVITKQALSPGSA